MTCVGLCFSNKCLVALISLWTMDNMYMCIYMSCQFLQVRVASYFCDFAINFPMDILWLLLGYLKSPSADLRNIQCSLGDLTFSTSALSPMPTSPPPPVTKITIVSSVFDFLAGISGCAISFGHNKNNRRTVSGN